MGKCVYCGEKVGLFSSEHKLCREQAETEAGRGALQIERAIMQHPPISETLQMLDEIRIRGKLDLERGLRSQWLRKADDAALIRSREQPISSHQFEDVAKIFEYLDPNFLKQGEGLLNWPGYISLDFSHTVYEVLHGITPYMPADIGSGFLMSRGENLIVKRNASLAEYRQQTSGGHYQSVSLPVGGGIYYRLGSTTPKISRTALEVVDQGTLALSDQAIYFGGRFQTFRISYEDILRLEPYKDAFEICENFGSSKVIVPATLGVDDGWFFFALISAFIDRYRT